MMGTLNDIVSDTVRCSSHPGGSNRGWICVDVYGFAVVGT